MSFTNFNLHPKVLSGVTAQGYDEPTPIQAKAIQPIMEGHDLIGLAQTGTGKTAAFVLPVLHRLMEMPRGRVNALIVSPTRELAEQTSETVNVLAKYTGLRSTSIYGGVGAEAQLRAIRSGVEVVVACPGRLLDHVLKGNLDLSFIEVLIIDEADRMFDMGFLPDIRSIVRCLTRPRQTLLFSATMPEDIRKLVSEVLHNPVEIKIGLSAPVNSVSHALYPVKPHLKTSLLKELLRTTESDSVLIFARTKHRVERLAQQLKRAGYKAAALQGDMEQWQRQEAMDSFRDGSLKILVATDIAARGLDILSITHVINFDMPDTTDAYTHRIGRTGRINNTGEAYTLITSEDRDMVKALERVFKKPLETRQVEGFDYTAEEPVYPETGKVYRQRNNFRQAKIEPPKAPQNRRKNTNAHDRRQPSGATQVSHSRLVSTRSTNRSPRSNTNRSTQNKETLTAF
jgi:ATP-dependent RNA helicase RhlE